MEEPNQRRNGADEDIEEVEDELLKEMEQDIEYRIGLAEEIERRTNQNMREAEFRAKNHGIYREIIEKEFLPEVTSSKYAACHFFHPDFRRCKSMDYHLEALAKDHLECKFIKLNAEKAAFFVDKLKVQMLPTVVLFKDGVAEDRLIGFDGVGDGSDNVSTQDVEKRLAKAGVIKLPYDQQPKTRGIFGTAYTDDDSDDDQ